MKKKIKKIFNEIFSSRRTKIAFCLCIMSFVLLISVSYAWFVSVKEFNHSTISTGTLDLVVRAYDETGAYKCDIEDAELIKENDEVDYPELEAISSILDINDWQVNEVKTMYLSIEKSGSMDVDFALSFRVIGSSDNLKRIGGFWYKITELPSDVFNNGSIKTKNQSGIFVDAAPGTPANEKYYNDIIANYQHVEFIPCGNQCVVVNDKVVHNCTEYHQDSGNLVTLSSDVRYDGLTSENNVTIYCIDIGFSKDSIYENYANTSFAIQGRVHATQVGAFDHPNGTGKKYTVSDPITLKKVIDDALPGDTIILGSNITFMGDLIINKCININTYGNDLVVNGNLLYNFASLGDLTLDLSQGGCIRVNKYEGAGGDFEIEAPEATVNIIGNGYNTDIYVASDVILNATIESGTNGLFISGANIYNKDGEPKDIFIKSDTRLTLDYGSSLEYVEAAVYAQNIEIINYGTIGEIDLGKMRVIDDYPNDDKAFTKYPQIYIVNYSTITDPIKLPSWSLLFEEKLVNGNTVYQGNTMIIREWGSSAMEISNTITNFTKNDIIDKNIIEIGVVQKYQDGDDTKLIVYYGNRSTDVDGTTSIEMLLTDYFKEKLGNDANEIENAINNIQYLEVIGVEEKLVTVEDLVLMKEIESLEKIDLFKINVVDNTIPADAFKNKLSLKEIVLPNTIVKLGTNAFSNTGILKLVIPASVEIYYKTSITGIRYIFYESKDFIKPSDGNDFYGSATQLLFVKEGAYDNYYNAMAVTGIKFVERAVKPYLYIQGEVTDDGNHVVRKTGLGYEIVCYTGSGGDLTPGTNLMLNNNIITITSIGQFAYCHIKEKYKVKLDPNIIKIDDYAFAGSWITYADLGSAKTLGNGVFSNCTQLTHLNHNNVVETIGDGAFYSSTKLFKVEFPQLISANTYYMFIGCSSLVSVIFGEKVESLSGGAAIQQTNSAMRELWVKNPDYMGGFGFINHQTNITNTGKLKVYCSSAYIETLDKRYDAMFHELGEKYGTNLVYDSTGTVSVNLGEFVYSKVSLIDSTGTLVNGISINCIPLAGYLLPSDFTLPNYVSITDENGDTENLPVIRLGYNCFKKHDFSNLANRSDINDFESQTVSNWYEVLENNGSNFILPETLIELGKWSFQDSNVRISNFRNVVTFDAGALMNCNRIYYVYAPKLKYAGNSCFSGANNIQVIEAENLKECGSSTFACKAHTFITDLQTIPDITWMYASTTRLVYLARTGYEKISIPPEGNKIIVAGNEFSSQFTENNYSNVYSIDNVRLGGAYIEEIYGNSQSAIYKINRYKYALEKVNEIDQEGNSIEGYKYIKYLETSFDDDYYIPSIYEGDGLPVLSIGVKAFSSIQLNNASVVASFNSKYTVFNGNRVILPDSLIKIYDGAFLGTDLGGLLNLNNVYYVGKYAFYKTDITDIVAPKLSSIAPEAFRYSNSLKTIKLLYDGDVNLANYYAFATCPSLEYLYAKSNLVYSSAAFSGTLQTIILDRVIESAAEINTDWNKNYSHATLYVPYECLDIYKEACPNFPEGKILPIGTVCGDDPEEQFVLVEIQGAYNYESGTYEKAWKVDLVDSQKSMVTIPEEVNGFKVISISKKAFEKNVMLETIVLSKNIKFIDEDTFISAPNLKNINVDLENPYFVSSNGVLYTKGYEELVCVPKYNIDSIVDGVFTIADETKVIRTGAFVDNENIVSVVAPSTLLYVCEYAFDNLVNLIGVKFTSNEVPVLIGEVFRDIQDLTIYVKVDAYENYSNNLSFSYYKLETYQ